MMRATVNVPVSFISASPSSSPGRSILFLLRLFSDCAMLKIASKDESYLKLKQNIISYLKYHRDFLFSNEYKMAE